MSRDYTEITDEQLRTINKRAIEQPSYEELREQNRVLRQLVQDVVNSGVAFEDGRIPYKEVQIDRTWFDDAQAALTATSQPGGTHEL